MARKKPRRSRNFGYLELASSWARDLVNSSVDSCDWNVHMRDQCSCDDFEKRVLGGLTEFELIILGVKNYERYLK